jgi:hypothetical protein
MLVAFADLSEAQYVRLAIDEITVTKTTDVSDRCGVIVSFRCGAANDRDEVYFVGIGVTTMRGIFPIPRVSPPPPNDYYGMKTSRDGGSATFRNIALAADVNEWVYLPNGHSAAFIVFVREQDNAQLAAINWAALAGLTGLLGVVAPGRYGPELEFTAAVAELGAAGVSLVESLLSDGDDTIGVFSVLIANVDNEIRSVWSPGTHTTLLSQSNAAAVFSANGGFTVRPIAGEPSSYSIRAHVQQLLTCVQNTFSNKCLEVPLGLGSFHLPTLAHQSPCQRSLNQSWILSPADVSARPAFKLIAALPTFESIVRHGGRCLDVVGADLHDHASIQQYPCHFRNNQQWRLTGQLPAFGLQNIHSNKCLDVPDANHAFIQQFSCHGGPNQRWSLSGYVPFAPE